jgi:hypothetical protein
MSDSQPRPARTCPDCGAELPENADFCWLCRKQPGPAKADAAPPTRPLKGIAAFFATLGIVVLVFVAAGIAFVATCFGGFLAGATARAKLGSYSYEYAPLVWGFRVGIPLGIIAASTVVYFSIRYFARRAREERAS